MTRKLECIRMDELGHTIPAAKELCRHAMKPLTEAVCNKDKHCDRKCRSSLCHLIVVSRPAVESSQCLHVP